MNDGFFGKLNMGEADNVEAKPAVRDNVEMMPFERGDHAELAERLLLGLNRDGVEAVFDEGSMYAYNPEKGVWAAVDERYLRKRVTGFASAPVRKGDDEFRKLRVNRSAITGAVGTAEDLAWNDAFFAGAKDGVSFANTFLEVRGDEIVEAELSPDNRARTGLGFDYNPDAKAPRFEGYLSEVFVDDVEGKSRLLLEFAGACLFGLATRYQRCLFLKGEGSNGKSVFIDVLSALFPDDARTSIAPQKFCSGSSSEYYVAELVGVRLNAVNEIPKGELLESKELKEIIAGDQVTARPIRRSPIHFRPTAGHVFSANTLPASRDTTHAFWRRMMLVTFDRTFSEDEQDTTLAATIIRDELPGVAAMAVEAAKGLLRRGKYTAPETHKRDLAAWRADANPVHTFLAECLVVGGEERTRSSDLFEHWRTWCAWAGCRPGSIQKFGRRLGDLADAIGFEKGRDVGGAYITGSVRESHLRELEDKVRARRERI